ncbi:hypothetical protein FRX31_012000 [Thalictrum thalictroides]|uniref:Uncharacterized protein n=1 Tax=Thalictrum thalictroides TaxID=46969 RepID=A0A7J6WQN4_THATH|nr:hypothetical protein FRX31_012000 [Thalictrum thalictroides]
MNLAFVFVVLVLSLPVNSIQEVVYARKDFSDQVKVYMIPMRKVGARRILHAEVVPSGRLFPNRSYKFAPSSPASNDKKAMSVPPPIFMV